MARPTPGARRIGPALALCLLVCLLLGAGCATSRTFFVPVAGATTVRGPEGHTAAEVTLEGDPQRRAEVQVWSHGAYREELEGKATTVVHVGFTLKNRGTVPLQLDERRLQLEDVALPDGILSQVPAFRVEGNTPVPPSETREVDAYFTLRRRVWPDDVFGYRVAWAVSGEGKTNVQRTAFQSTRHYRGGYAGYYGPGYPWWGWYFGPPYAYYPPYYYLPYYYPPYRYWVQPPAYGPRLYGPRVLGRPRAR